MLHVVDKAASSSDGQVLDKLNLSDRRNLAFNQYLPLQNSCFGQKCETAQKVHQLRKSG
jgi:hypothetical protein